MNIVYTHLKRLGHTSLASNVNDYYESRKRYFYQKTKEGDFIADEEGFVHRSNIKWSDNITDFNIHSLNFIKGNKQPNIKKSKYSKISRGFPRGVIAAEEPINRRGLEIDPRFREQLVQDRDALFRRLQQEGMDDGNLDLDVQL